MRDQADIRAQLGQTVKRLRAERQLTQEQLSHRTGIHPTYLSDIERGARNPSFFLLIRLIAGLDTSLGELGVAYDRQVGRRRG
jgi:transcriptional regulator with XRE-family HTH domain